VQVNIKKTEIQRSADIEVIDVTPETVE
jgi:hypothetical protein